MSNKLYESLYSLLGTWLVHFNDLLRQQSENAYLKSKNRWILGFWRVFLDFIIFSNFDSFKVGLLLISIPWRVFLPRGGAGSLWGWIFTQNHNFIKDVIGRNKNDEKYQPLAIDEFIIPPSSRALPLHVLIISLFLPGKIVKLRNDLANFSHTVKLRSKIFKLSFNFHLKTSCSLPPYYSLELCLISSTSHSTLFWARGLCILMICCDSRAKMHIWSRKIDESWGFGVFFLIS